MFARNIFCPITVASAGISVWQMFTSLVNICQTERTFVYYWYQRLGRLLAWHNTLLAVAVIPSVDNADFWLWQIFLQSSWSRWWTLVSNWNQDSKSEISFEAITMYTLHTGAREVQLLYTVHGTWDRASWGLFSCSSVQWAAGGQRSNCSCCSTESSEWRQLWFQLEWQQQKFQQTFVCCLLEMQMLVSGGNCDSY